MLFKYEMYYKFHTNKRVHKQISNFFIFYLIHNDYAMKGIKILYLQAQTGGIVMVSFYPHFISCGEKSTLQDVAGEL